MKYECQERFINKINSKNNESFGCHKINLPECPMIRLLSILLKIAHSKIRFMKIPIMRLHMFIIFLLFLILG